MNFSEAMKEVESHGFAARLNLGSDLKTFLKGAKSEESVRVLLGEMKSSEKRAHVLSRVMRISQNLVDRRYENPWDVSLAVYIWALSFTDLEFAKVAAQSIDQVSNCWWARQIADELLSGGHIHTTAGVQEISRQFVTSYDPAWWQTVLSSTGEGLQYGVIYPGQLTATTTVIENIRDNSTAGEMIVASGFLGMGTIVSASLSTGSHGTVNNEPGWLGQVRPPYTIENPLELAA